MYDLTKVSEYTGQGVLQPGEYPAVIANAEVCRSKAGSPMVKVTLEISGNHIYEYLTLDTNNQKGFNIALSKAKSILTAVGSGQMHFRNEMEMADAMVGELMVTLDIKQEEYMGSMKEKNIIKKYSALPVVTRARIQRQPIPSVKDVKFNSGRKAPDFSVDDIPFSKPF